jgi:predicted ATPase
MSLIGRVTRFGLRNFKAFHYLEDIELKPLTVLVGANSSGKSSIFQALLLLKQSSEAGRSSGVLKFNGELTKLGNFSTIISDFDPGRVLEYRFTVELSSGWALREGFPNGPVDASRPSPAKAPASSEVTFRFASDARTREALVRGCSIITRLPSPSDDSQTVVLESDEATPQFTVRNLHSPFKDAVGPYIGVAYSGFWPSDLEWLQDVGFGPVRAHYALSAFPALATPRDVLKEWLVDELEYLGPLRADPRPFYPMEEEPALGTRGEGTVPYLLRRQHDIVHYASSHAGELQMSTLLEAVNHWLSRMGVTTHLAIEPVESIAFTAAVQSISSTKKSVNLSQVGFGISQILPVLVMGLKGPDDGWLLFEQPEIHLHPRLQGELADFFLATAHAGKTVMVETHSDHLVSRLRRRIAEDESGELAKMVQILFVHAGTPDNPSSYAEPLTVDVSGNILNWPADFFSETADEAFAILESRRRRARKGG